MNIQIRLASDYDYKRDRIINTLSIFLRNSLIIIVELNYDFFFKF